MTVEISEADVLRNSLKRLAYEPGVVVYDPPKGCTKDLRDAMLQNAVNEFLSIDGAAVMLWRQNTGGMKVGKRFITFGLPGQADIAGVMKPIGQWVALEAKRPGKKSHQSIYQKRYQQMVEGAGGFYWVFKSPDEAVSAVRQVLADCRALMSLEV